MGETTCTCIIRVSSRIKSLGRFTHDAKCLATPTFVDHTTYCYYNYLSTLMVNIYTFLLDRNLGKKIHVYNVHVL